MAFVYSREVADEICRLISEGLSLSEVCRKDGMPHRRRVHEWIDENHDGFAHRYTRAREERTELLAEEIIAIGDSVRRGATSEEVNAARLASDNRKWIASKLMPQRYGDKLAIGGDPKNPLFPNMTTEQLEAEAIRKLVALGIGEEQAAAIVRDRKRP